MFWNHVTKPWCSHKKTSSSSSFHPPFTQHMVFRFLRFCRLFSKLLHLHLHDQRIARHHRLTELHLFLEEKQNNQKTSQVIHPGCLGHVFVWLVVIDVYVKTTHHLWFFHYLVETNAEVIFCCAVSLCLDADYLRRFRMFTSWRRPAKGHHRCPRRALDHQAAYRPRRPIAPKPSWSLKQTTNHYPQNVTFKLTGNMAHTIHVWCIYLHVP